MQDPFFLIIIQVKHFNNGVREEQLNKKLNERERKKTCQNRTRVKNLTKKNKQKKTNESCCVVKPLQHFLRKVTSLNMKC